jgi:hypothetical protein
MANITNKPMAYITVNKGRTKTKKDKFVYLENGAEFEIELHNPTQNTVLAKISINNKLISYSGIVLRPGERVFLERYLDNSNKFKFETYTVGGNSEEVKKAIELNGLVKIEFYNEDTTPVINYPIVTTASSTPFWNPTWQTTVNPTWTLGDQYSSGTYTLGNSTTTTASLSDSSMMYCSTATSSLPIGTTYTTNGPNLSGSISASAGPPSARSFAGNLKKEKKSVETGRVEQGSHSSQSFQTVNKKFHYYTTNIVELQIKPVSQMYIDAKDINKMNKHCVKCGRKSKHGDNFCGGCGNRF